MCNILPQWKWNLSCCVFSSCAPREDGYRDGVCTRNYSLLKREYPFRIFKESVYKKLSIFCDLYACVSELYERSVKSEYLELYTYMTGTMRGWRATLPYSCERFIVPKLCIREINVSDYSSKLRTSFLSLHEYISKSILTLDDPNETQGPSSGILVIVVTIVVQLIRS